MPTIRKVAPEVAATWGAAPAAAPGHVPAPADRRGLTRMNYPSSGSIGWMVRVYHAGAVFTRYFSDARNGGPASALLRAEIWRDELRERVAERADRPSQAVRLVRVDRPDQKLVGWYAYVHAGGRRARRYFSDARHGAGGGARAMAEQWAAELSARLGAGAA